MRESQTTSDFEKSTPAFCTSQCVSSVCSHPRRPQTAEGVFLALAKPFGGRSADLRRPRLSIPRPSFFLNLRKELQSCLLRSERSTGTRLPGFLELPPAEQNGTSPPHVSPCRQTNCTMENPSTVRSTRNGWSMLCPACRPAQRPPMMRRHRKPIHQAEIPRRMGPGWPRRTTEGNRDGLPHPAPLFSTPKRSSRKVFGLPESNTIARQSPFSAVEQWQLARPITWRSQVRILPAQLTRTGVAKP